MTFELICACIAGGSRLASDLPDDLYGPGSLPLAPQWSHDGKGAGLLVSVASLHYRFACCSLCLVSQNVIVS